MNLAPALQGHAIDVWEMRYPNDQPIVESARFFYDEIKRLRQSGIAVINIVAHSMGGLVSREMLTNPDIAYPDKAQSGAAPGVARLIMVGTPNHGSEFARYRMFAEIRDQWINMINGRGHILRGILDGAGEAKIDLLPESEFLQTLNQRPHPAGVRMLSIAGIVTWDEKDISEFMQPAKEDASASTQEMLADMETLLQSMADGLGDGVVTVESTRLEGVEHRSVRGTHLSMIRNITESSGRIPPAIPLIVDFLTKP